MSTKNIECQLAQGQIGRYLNGERFSTQAIKQLEAHVVDCDECSELVTRRRQALLTMLGERNNNLAVVSPATSSEPKAEPKAAVIPEPEIAPATKVTTEAATAPVPSTPLAAKTQIFAQVMSSKPLLYTSALAAVLIGMSYFSKSALKAFGPTADLAVRSETPTIKAPLESKPVIEPTPISTPAVTHPGSTVATTPPITKPTAVHPAAVVDNSVRSNNDSTDDQDQTDDTPVAPVKHVVAARTIHHRKLAATRKTHRLARATRRPATRRVVRRNTRIRARQIARPRVAMVTRHRFATHTFHRAFHAQASGIKIYDPQGRPLQ